MKTLFEKIWDRNVVKFASEAKRTNEFSNSVGERSSDGIMSKAINKIVSTAVPIDIGNIDTDQIIPARFLKATSRDGFGDNLFGDWRYNSDGTPKKDFVLNNPAYNQHATL
jgi:hypothetical protein